MILIGFSFNIEFKQIRLSIFAPPPVEITNDSFIILRSG